eukprot:s108_g39.t1
MSAVWWPWQDYAGYASWAQDGYAQDASMAAWSDVQETSSWAGQGSSLFSHGAFSHSAVQEERVHGYMAMDEQPSRWTSKPPLRAPRSEDWPFRSHFV